MKLFFLKIERAFWLSQAYLAYNINDHAAVQTALYQVQKIDWKLKWQIDN